MTEHEPDPQGPARQEPPAHELGPQELGPQELSPQELSPQELSPQELSPQEEDEVSRLLSEAAGPEPLPADLTARLDDVLATLVAERAAGTHPVPVLEESATTTSGAVVVPLRSRRWPKLMLAAAAVAVVGYTGANLPRLTGTTNADSSPASAEAPESSKDSSSRGDAGGEAAPSTPPIRRPLPAGQSLTELELKAADALRRQLSGTTPMPQYAGGTSFLKDAEAGCVPVPVAGRSQTFEVELDATHSVTVVLTPLSGDRTRADAYPCRGPATSVATAIIR